MKKTLSQLCFLKTTRTTLDNFFSQSFLRSLRDISTAHLNFVRRRNKNGLRTKKICTADEIYFIHSAPIVAPQCKFISTAVRFLTYFLAPVGTGFHACLTFERNIVWNSSPERGGAPTGRRGHKLLSMHKEGVVHEDSDPSVLRTPPLSGEEFLTRPMRRPHIINLDTKSAPIISQNLNFARDIEKILCPT